MDLNQKNEMYTPQINHLKTMLDANKFYTVVLSAFDLVTKMGGLLTLESNWPMKIEPLPQEGYGLHKIDINGVLNEQNSGGSRNFPSFGKNPAWALRVIGETEIMFRVSLVT